MASPCSKSLLLAPHLLLLLLLLFMASTQAASTNEEEAMKPVGASERQQQQLLVLLPSKPVSESQRRKLGSFQICALCTCCGGPKGLCLPSPCCYSINCNIPNRPFGFCAFTPTTCNCFRCHL